VLQDRRSRSLSLLIDQVQKLSRGFSITKGAMMLFQVDLIDIAKVAKAVGFLAPPHARAGAEVSRVFGGEGGIAAQPI
jgi:hypothetical protein